MTILLTGAAGFIGSNVALALLERGENVIGIDNLNDHYSPARKQHTVDLLSDNPNFIFVKADIRDKAAMHELFEKHKITSVIHLAGRGGVRPSIADPELYITTNLIGTVNLLELSHLHHVTNFVFASSSSVYGNSAKIPFSEDQKVDEPISPYAASKKAAENIAYTYSALYKLPVTCLRFFTAYGPRSRPDMAPYIFLDRVHRGEPIDVYGDGTTYRDYTFVGDVVDGIIAAHDHPHPYEVINLGNGSPVKLSDFISAVERVTGKKAKQNHKPMQPGDVDRTFADITKAKKLLSYAPSTNLDEGLRQTYEWYLAEVAAGRIK